MASTPFTNVNFPRVLRNPAQYRVACQSVVDDGIRLLQKFSAAQGKKPCIARTRADKVDFPQRRQCRLSR